MITYSFTKTVKSDKLLNEIIQAGISSPLYIETVDNQVNVNFENSLSPEDISTLGYVVSNHQTLSQAEYIEQVVSKAREFGNELIKQGAAENIALGITQAGMTNAVRKRLSEITNALMTGSLYDAITEARAVPAENKDTVFITDARLLALVNKLEAYLGLPLSEEL